MGQTGKQGLTRRELEDYVELTYLSRDQLQKACAIYRDLVGVDVNWREMRVPFSALVELPILRANPFADRLLGLFASTPCETAPDSLSFEDFLDMLSVLSTNATVELKACYAFRVFDMDGDGQLGMNDMQELLRKLTGTHALSPGETAHVVESLLDAADLNNDGSLALYEFMHLARSMPEIHRTYSITL